MKSELKVDVQPRNGGLHGWFEERLEVDSIWRALFLRKVPFGVSWLYTAGFASMAILIIQMVTGVVLALYYAPTPDHAWDSVQYVMTDLPYGSVIRGIHHWGASAMVVMVVLHLLVVFVMGAYKYPREMTWVVGVLLLLITLGFGFTGYLLPWDEKAYWATTVGTNMVGTIPVIGGFLVKVTRGGAELGALTLTRFYAAHIMLLPMAIAGLAGAHLFMVIRQGVSVPPSLWDRANSTPDKRTSSLHADSHAGTPHEEYRRQYENFKSRGRPFFPDIIFEDAVVAVIVTLIVVALAAIFGAPLESQADPTNTSYVPRPEWYFLFIFEMLKYFPGEVEWIGVAVVPGLFILLLFGLPFISRQTRRMPRHHPIGMAVASITILAIAVLTILALQSTPHSGAEGASLSPEQVAGRKLVQAQGCVACHAVGGQGGQSAPSLDGIGSRRDRDYLSSYVENPKKLNPGATMPGYSPPLTREQVENIAQYLMTLE